VPEEKRVRSDNSINIQVVTTPEQFMRAMAVRAIVFMEHGGLTADQAIDGNDYQATHILVSANGEPVASARVRWFQDFAKIERTAFRPAYRDPRILKRAGLFIFEHAAKKGYRQVITQAEPKFVPLWERLLGFELVKGRQPITALGHEPYFEMIKTLAPVRDVITLESDPKILLRIEGQWDRPGQFEGPPDE
jgi:hypothetical protein